MQKLILVSLAKQLNKFFAAMHEKTNPRSIFLPFVLFLCIFLKTHTSLGADTISAGQSLSGDRTTVSAGGTFALGFFTPGNSSKHYIGIWYQQLTTQTVVWVANREKPVLDRFSSELRISNGNLVLFSESKLPIWSTNVSSTSSLLIRAVLSDNGNLVLEEGSKSSKPLWESFDHPTHTLLPGCKLGLNKKTQEKKILSSWKNPEDPAPGLFTLEPHPSDSSFVILRNGSRKIWTTGTWVERLGTFSAMPDMQTSTYYNFTYVTNDNESYFTYAVEHSSYLHRLVMDLSGQFRELIFMPNKDWKYYWYQPAQPCQIYASCGAYGRCNENSLPYCSCLRGFKPKYQSYWDLAVYSDGCTRTTELQCASNNRANGKRDRFLEMPSMSSPDNKQSVQVLNMSACKSTCLNNCSCTAYSFDSDGCSIWMGDLLDLQQLAVSNETGRTLYIRLDVSEFHSPKYNKGLIIGVVAGAVAGSLVAMVLISFFMLRRKKRLGTGKATEGSLMAFSYKDLQNATKNFSEKLGGGSFGPVFKGMLSDSTTIAVKKLESVGQGEKQFRAEVSTIGTIQHVNLVLLRGFCSEGTKRLLVYEYMSNGSLDSHLFHKNNSIVLNWKTRYKIALGIARALVYLHERCRHCIIHCDIKPENVLLDAEFCPKVADFGLAKLLGREFSRVLTTMRGTRGYLAPEWVAGVAITPKADIYSFGMMLFELVSGRRNWEQTKSEQKFKYFPSAATSIVVEGGDVLSLLDERLEGDGNIEEVERVLKVASWCIQDNEACRPSMSQVVQILEGNIEVNVPPIPRYLHLFDDNEGNVTFFVD